MKEYRYFLISYNWADDKQNGSGSMSIRYKGFPTLKWIKENVNSPL